MRNCLERQLHRALDELYEAQKDGMSLMYNSILKKYHNAYVSLYVEEIAGLKINEYCNHLSMDVDPHICNYCQHLLDRD
jgi:hypothetical protein